MSSEFSEMQLRFLYELKALQGSAARLATTADELMLYTGVGGPLDKAQFNALQSLECWRKAAGKLQ